MRFPWAETGGALLRTDLPLLSAAVAATLASLLVKGWAWQRLLVQVTPMSWWRAQRATLTGAALTSLSTGVVGEAARAREIVRSQGTSWQVAVTSIVVLRLVEGIGFAIFLVVVALYIDLPPELRVAHVLAAVAIALGAAALWFRGWGRWTSRLPARLRHGVELLGAMVAPRQLPAPVTLAVANWIFQWAAYSLTIRATHVQAPAAAALVALLFANLVGLVAVTPGNVGVFQASIVVALLPFGVALQQAILVGIVLQAILVLPVLGAAMAVLGTRALGQLGRQETAIAAGAEGKAGGPRPESGNPHGGNGISSQAGDGTPSAIWKSRNP
jgi:uncharacterized membrane protein YbhN (UPF0104 family)